MPTLLCVTRRVAIERVVAAQGSPALLAGTQVHPFGAHFHTLLAFPVLRLFDLRHCGNVRAPVSWHGWMKRALPQRARQVDAVDVESREVGV